MNILDDMLVSKWSAKVFFLKWTTPLKNQLKRIKNWISRFVIILIPKKLPTFRFWKPEYTIHTLWGGLASTDHQIAVQFSSFVFNKMEDQTLSLEDNALLKPLAHSFNPPDLAWIVKRAEICAVGYWKKRKYWNRCQTISRRMTLICWSSIGVCTYIFLTNNNRFLMAYLTRCFISNGSGLPCVHLLLRFLMSPDRENRAKRRRVITATHIKYRKQF